MTRCFIIAVMLSIPLSAHGQEPLDALTTCVADTTSGKDRKDLAKWIFLAMAAHPAMKDSTAVVGATASDDSARTMAALVMRLLAESCVKETKAVFNAGQGAQALGLAFQSLGQLAMQELMADPSVKGAMSLFERYIDQKRLAEVFGGK